MGHSAGVAQLASAAAQQCGFPAAEVTAIRRAALLHDVGRVGISARIWQKAAALTPGEWEQVRLHAYHTERVLSRSPFLARLAPIATFHHERLDDTGYHRGVAAPSLSPAACLLAVADAYQTKTEPRPHREALSPAQAADLLGREARARPAGCQLCRRGAGGGWSTSATPTSTGRLDRARGRGSGPARQGTADQADRTRAGHLSHKPHAEDGALQTVLERESDAEVRRQAPRSDHRSSADLVPDHR